MTAANLSARELYARHRFPPGADRLKRDAGIRALDGDDDGGQVVACLAPPAAAQQHLGTKPMYSTGLLAGCLVCCWPNYCAAILFDRQGPNCR